VIDTPQTLDAAIAAQRRARRVKLQRSIRSQRIRTRVSFAMTGCVALFALAAFFLAHDREAAVILTIITCVSFGVNYSAGKVGRKKAIDSLRDFEGQFTE
jgi:O-antigen/teichoic acid export membrane protein